ncbi:hypothetical protein [Oceanicola sp. 502str15]|uniref:hypothetical protein n=1 Tax=Oceanicola sp. 502str15 TaxID=2696061 RepID=UPI002095F848|nr:hypothetical protein [Oceanicola sp. 502str15]MCO6382476.1 hypothetical protein [Oceanicola sp. 502str15]
MSPFVFTLAQIMGTLSMLVLIGAVCLITLRTGLGIGAAVAVGMVMLGLGFLLPTIVRILIGSLGLPGEYMIMAHPIGGFISSVVVLIVALIKWPRPQ